MLLQQKARLIADIDEAVYDAYGLSSRERQEIEKVMSAGKRPA